MPTPQAAPTDQPLRLALSAKPGTDTLDGAWWPRSRDLVTELGDLVAHFPPAAGRPVRALYSPPDWDPAPRRIPVPGGSIKVGAFPRDDTHVMIIRTADRTVLRLLVVPPSMSAEDADEAMLAASTTGNTHAAAELLHAVTDTAPVDPAGFWPATT